MKSEQTPQSKWELSLGELSRQLYLELVINPESTRFLKLLHKGGGLYTATLGTFNQEGIPSVVFGSGESLWGCLRSLGRNLKAGEYKPDNYAKDTDYALGEVLLRRWQNEGSPKQAEL